MTDEARLEELASGLAPATDGWFVVNVRGAAWETGPFGAGCFFESGGSECPRHGIRYPLSEPALRHGVGVEKETTSP